MSAKARRPPTQPAPGCASLHPGGLQLTRQTIQTAGFATGQTLIDLGCGSGASLDQLRQAGGGLVIGVDIHPLTGEHTGQTRVCADAAHLPFAGACCQGLLAECCLSTLPDLPQVLCECNRVLAQGGYLAINDLYQRVDAEAGATAAKPGLLERSEWIAMLQTHGLRPLVWEDHTPALHSMAAQAIFGGQSLTGLWECLPQANASARQEHSARQRPGYFVLTAQKEFHQ